MKKTGVSSNFQVNLLQIKIRVVTNSLNVWL